MKIPEFANYDGKGPFIFNGHTYSFDKPIGEGVQAKVSLFFTENPMDSSKYYVVVKEEKKRRGLFSQGLFFLQELNAWRAVYSKNIPQMSGDPRDNSKPHYLLTPFIDCPTFETVVIRRSKSLTISDIACYLIAIAQSIKELHTTHNLMHGDITIHNVLFDARKPQIAFPIDFGVSSFIVHPAVIFPRVLKDKESHIAPEVREPGEWIAHPAQDYYGFGDLVKRTIKRAQPTDNVDSKLLSEFGKMRFISNKLQHQVPSERWDLTKTIYMFNVFFISKPERPLVTENTQLQGLVDQWKSLEDEIAKKADETKAEKLNGLIFLYVILTQRILIKPDEAAQETKALFPKITKGLWSRSEKVLDGVAKLPLLQTPAPEAW